MTPSPVLVTEKMFSTKSRRFRKIVAICVTQHKKILVKFWSEKKKKVY